MAASPFENVATAVITLFNDEFATEQFEMVADNLHESLGRDGVYVGIAPVEDVLKSGNDVVQETWAEVRFYDMWVQEIDPKTQVNPFRITGFAERFRKAIKDAAFVASGQVWYFDLRRIQYPNDPTGNKTRFVATIRAFGNNSALVETGA